MDVAFPRGGGVVEEVLTQLGIEYEAIDHPAVYTCEQAERLLPTLSGVATKNIFLRDEKGERHILLVVPDKKRVDLQGVAGAISATRLSFASPERLMARLGVEPGSVSLLALINDSEHRVELVIDEEVWAGETLQCHPLINTRTLVISRRGVERFFASTGHVPCIIPVPELEDV